MSESLSKVPVGRSQAGWSDTARSNTGTSTLPSLTALRFIAAFAVFLFHTAALSNTIPPFRPVEPFADEGVSAMYNKVFFNGGFVGVSFFFVLSGFVLAWSTRSTEGTFSFWRRRFLKIYPNHFVVFVVAMILFAAAITPMSEWLPALFLVHSWSLDGMTRWAVNSPSWSLCAELLFYFLFPFVIRPLRRIAESRLWIWVGGLFAAMVVVALFNHFVIPSLMPDPASAGTDAPTTGPASATGPQYWFGYFLPPLRLLEFLLGIVLARIVLAGRWPRFGVASAAALVAAAYVLSIFLPAVFVFNVTTVLPLGFLICAVASADICGSRSALRGRTWQWLGQISFAFYLCQGVVLLWGRELMNGSQHSVPVGFALILAFFIANLVAGALLYRYVEQPIMRRWGRRSGARPAVGAANGRRQRTGMPAKSATRDQ